MSLGTDVLAELFQERLAGHAHVYLTETTYFVVGKVVDLLIEELTHEQGDDLYANGRARNLALKFYAEGSRALGSERWAGLLRSFNSLMRVNAGASGSKATVEEFFQIAEAARWDSRRKNVTSVLELVCKARPHAEEFQTRLSSIILPALEPLIPAVAQTARYWYEIEAREIRICHDKAPALARPGAIEAILRALRYPGEFARYTPAIKIADIVLLDSAKDSRIQVADFIAGFGSRISAAVLAHSYDQELLNLLRPMVGAYGLWGDQQTWNLLADSAPT